jgi:hypothetical protein
MALLASTGALTFLRVNRVGGKFGPPNDQIDAEVVAKLDTEPDRAMGFQLRDDTDRASHQGMLDLLRDAFNNGGKVTIDYDLPTGKKNGMAIRVALRK